MWNGALMLSSGSAWSVVPILGEWDPRRADERLGGRQDSLPGIEGPAPPILVQWELGSVGVGFDSPRTLAIWSAVIAAACVKKSATMASSASL